MDPRTRPHSRAGDILGQDGTGCWASAPRGLIMSLQLVASSTFAMRTCASDAELVAWIIKPDARRTGVELEPKALDQALADVRAAGDRG